MRIKFYRFALNKTMFGQFYLCYSACVIANELEPLHPFNRQKNLRSQHG